MPTQKAKMTNEAVNRVITEGRLSSLTQVSKALGLGKGSVSGSVAKRMRALIPNLGDILAANKPAKRGAADATPMVKKAAKKPTAKPQSEAAEEGERLCPFRMGTKYAAIWMLLFQAGKAGTTREQIVERLVSKGLSDAKTASYAVTVVASPTEDGRAHRSADRAADLYWVEKADGGNLRMHLRDAKF